MSVQIYKFIVLKAFPDGFHESANAKWETISITNQS